MNRQFEGDPLDSLRAADPVDVDRLSSASLARIRARVSEEVTTPPHPQRTMPRWARTLSLATGLAAVGALVLVLAFGGRDLAPGIVPGGSDGPGSAVCVEPYSRTAITRRTFAFEGTVSSIDGERVTFTIGAAYRGAAGTSITLDAPGMTGTAITSGSGPRLAVGQRYLVAGDDHFVWACGYTQPWDPTVAAEWEAALGG
jgi:hypothetical protein